MSAPLAACACVCLRSWRCWQRVEQDGVSCVDAIRTGQAMPLSLPVTSCVTARVVLDAQDCHCKCASIYFTQSGVQGRAPWQF